MINHTYQKLSHFSKKLVIYQLVILILAGLFVIPIQAAEPLKIDQINITHTDENATITWQTNRPATGKVEYGETSDNYFWSLQTNQKKTEQAITIFGLQPETDYYLKITATDDVSEVKSFEQTFKTDKRADNTAPVITKVSVPYITGTTATIQWLTDEPATSEVEYGLSENYGSKRTSNSKVRVHDITITGLTPARTYHFKVKSKDKDNNTATWHDMTFKTQFNNRAETDELIIYNVTPSSENDPNITTNSAVISWRTNKYTQGWVRYGTSIRYGKLIASNPPRDFFQSITLTNLTPGKTYYFEIQVKDVFGKQVKSSGYSFTTKLVTSGNNSGSPSVIPQILGASTCDVDLKTDFGYYGLYYNLVEGHPDVELYKGQPITWSKIARQNDWYNPEYFVFSRVDRGLEFGGRFFPVNEGKPGDPFHFAVNWRAIIEVPQNDFYSYKITSDDDAWVFINDQLIVDLGGVHAPQTKEGSIHLPAGYHKLEIYYAERSRGRSHFDFIPDRQLKFHPLPEGCSIDDVLSYQGTGNQGFQFTGNNQNQGQVLGVSYDDTTGQTTPTPVKPYVCNPDLGYTKFKALYKTTDSPDVWAILETGQKHYITSPEAFAKYQCDWRDVKIVSRAKLNNYANARLVRTPTDPMIYYLFQRPQTKWLKVNIPSPTVFISYPDNYWGNVARVDILDILAYPDARLIKVEDNSNVYLIENTYKRHIASESVFESLLYDWAEVVEISQIHLDSFEDGQVID